MRSLELEMKIGLGLTFHPELTQDRRFHRLIREMEATPDHSPADVRSVLPSRRGRRLYTTSTRFEIGFARQENAIGDDYCPLRQSKRNAIYVSNEKKCEPEEVIQKQKPCKPRALELLEAFPCWILKTVEAIQQLKNFGQHHIHCYTSIPIDEENAGLLQRRVWKI